MILSRFVAVSVSLTLEVSLLQFRGNSHIYQMEKGHIHAGLVRVVWELNDVAIDSGGERPDCLWTLNRRQSASSVAADRRAFWGARDALYPRES